MKATKVQKSNTAPDPGWPFAISPFRWARALRKEALEVYRSRHVIRNLVATELKVRYQRSILGFLWTLLNPVLMLSVLALVFSAIMKLGVSDYAVFLFSGLLPWQFFSGAVTSGCRSLLANETLIKKAPLKKLVFPVSQLLVALVNLLFSMTALFILLQFIAPAVHLQLVILPACLLLMAMFTFGVILIAMTLVTYFRDFEHITDVLLNALYFATPILYPASVLGKHSHILEWNPLTHLVRLFRCAIYEGSWPSGQTWFLAALSSVLTLVAGYIVYKRYEHRYIFRL